jgi:hypothetical protein
MSGNIMKLILFEIPYDNSTLRTSNCSVQCTVFLTTIITQGQVSFLFPLLYSITV